MTGSVPGSPGRSPGLRVGALLMIASLGLAGCVNAGGSAIAAPLADGASTAAPKAAVPTPSAQSGPPTVAIRQNTATPATIQVSTGATVEVRNFDSVAHNLADKAHRLYDGDIPAKGKGELTAPAIAGTYVFTDRRHPKLRLTLKVS